MRLFDNLLASAPVRYETAASGQGLVATPLSLWERVQHLCDARFHLDLAEQNVQTLERALMDGRRLTPLQAQSDPLINQVRSFEKSAALQRIVKITRGSSAPAHQALNERVQALSARLLAARLGLSKEEMESAPGLKELAEKHRIYNYMARYNEGCQMLDGEVWIKQGGEMTRWAELPDELKAVQRRAPGQPWPYDATGLVDRSMDDWPDGRIQPFFYADPRSWGGGYVMSLCTSTFEEPRLLAGDHTWIRLYDPKGGTREGEGAIYAVGLYRPIKRDRSEMMNAPLRVKPGTVRLDFSEFWGEPITELDFRIDEDKFQLIRARLEQDHASEAVPFQLVDQNCTRYALELAELADVQIEAQTSFARLLLPRRIAGVAQRIFDAMPRCVQSLLLRISGLFWNLVQVRLGATRVDPEILRKDPERVNSFSSLADAIRCSGSRPQALPTPWRLGQEITRSIKEQRGRRRQELGDRLQQAAETGDTRLMEQLRRELAEVRYWLPPENRGIRQVPSPFTDSEGSLDELIPSPLRQQQAAEGDFPCLQERSAALISAV